MVNRLKMTYQSYTQKYGQIDYVIHSAGIHRAQKLIDFKKGNDSFSREFYQALSQLETPIKKYVYISSMAAQGAGDPNTMKPLQEDDVCRPVSPYGKSKRNAEMFLLEQQKPDWLIFRPTAVYGPGDHNFPKLYELLAKGIDLRIGSDQRKISLVHVKDLAGVIIESLSSNYVNKIYNVSDGQAYSQEEFHKTILDKIGRKAIRIKISQGLAKGIGHLNAILGKIRGRVVHLNTKKIEDLCAMNWSVDISAVQKDFNFDARYSLEVGLMEAVEDYFGERK